METVKNCGRLQLRKKTRHSAIATAHIETEAKILQKFDFQNEFIKNILLSLSIIKSLSYTIKALRGTNIPHFLIFSKQNKKNRQSCSIFPIKTSKRAVIF
jgi:hypothetical protein